MTRLGRFDRAGIAATLAAVILPALGWWLRRIDRKLGQYAGDE